MNAWIIIIGIIIFLLVVIYFLKLLIKKRLIKSRELVTNIPEDVLEDFNEAERRLKESKENGRQTNPHTILWEISKSKQAAKPNRTITTNKPRTSETNTNNELSEVNQGRRNLSNGTSPNPNRGKRRTNNHKRKYRSVISRLRRRRRN